MSKIIMLLSICFFIAQNAISQKLYVVPGLIGQYSYFSRTSFNEPDFSTKPKFNGTWFVDVCYKPQKTLFKISVKESVLGENFRIKNDFGNDTSLGIHKINHSNGIDHLIFTFQIQKNIFTNNNQSDAYVN